MGLPLGVPLHRQGEAARAIHHKSLDQAVGRVGLDTQTRRQLIDALSMHRVDLDRIALEQCRQKTACHQIDLMRQRKDNRRFGVLRAAVVAVATAAPAAPALEAIAASKATELSLETVNPQQEALLLSDKGPIFSR